MHAAAPVIAASTTHPGVGCTIVCFVATQMHGKPTITESNLLLLVQLAPAHVPRQVWRSQAELLLQGGQQRADEVAAGRCDRQRSNNKHLKLPAMSTRRLRQGPHDSLPLNIRGSAAAQVPQLAAGTIRGMLVREASEATHVPQCSIAPVRCGVGAAGDHVAALRHVSVHVGVPLDAMHVSVNRSKATQSIVGMMTTQISARACGCEAPGAILAFCTPLFDTIQTDLR